VRIRLIMPAIIDQASRPFNVDEADGIRRRHTLQNIEAILRAAGTSLTHAVECLCLLHDIGDFAAFNEVYRSFFPKDPPARTTVQAVLPRPGLLVEIRAVAAMPPRNNARGQVGHRRAPAKGRRRR
jgi:hypothetical protein